MDGISYKLIGTTRNQVLTSLLQPREADQKSRSTSPGSQAVSFSTEPRKNEYDVSIGLELVLSDVNDIEPPQASCLHDQIKCIEDSQREIRRIYEELHNVAGLITRRWNSNVESMSASKYTHHQFAPMKSQFKEDMKVDNKWSYDEWVIGFSRSLSDDFLPRCAYARVTFLTTTAF